ncbi:alanine racemase [Candidatus Falkowbacteria bacterium]|nr:alanine racemase [Candidatus Falkowbacteria bacterium]
MEDVNSWLEISTSALLHNIRQFRRVIPQRTKLAAVIKANAYGHGMLGVARVIHKEVDWLCVADLVEALTLRDSGIKKPILVLSYYFDNLEQAIRKNISLVVYSWQQAQALDRTARSLHQKAKIHFKIDVGTSRLGLNSQTEALAVLKKIASLNNVVIEGLFSHFADSENNLPYSQQQLQVFKSFIKEAEALGMKIPLMHLACSAPVTVLPEACFDLVRLGVSMYGSWPSPAVKKLTLKKYPRFSLRPILTWKTRVMVIKTVPKSTFIGYGSSYRSKQTLKIAILPVGYWDGYDRSLSNQGEVLIRGRRCPVRGRVCMNMMMVDATSVRGLRLGDEAVLLGQQGAEEITIAETAEKASTIHNEITTRINAALPRVFVK